MRAELKSCVARLLALAESDAGPSARVYHVNLNFFPVSKTVPR